VLFLELDRERDRRWIVQVVGNEGEDALHSMNGNGRTPN
jgi:hypothetical protein